MQDQLHSETENCPCSVFASEQIDHDEHHSETRAHSTRDSMRDATDSSVREVTPVLGKAEGLMMPELVASVVASAEVAGGLLVNRE